MILSNRENHRYEYLRSTYQAYKPSIWSRSISLVEYYYVYDLLLLPMQSWEIRIFLLWALLQTCIQMDIDASNHGEERIPFSGMDAYIMQNRPFNILPYLWHRGIQETGLLAIWFDHATYGLTLMIFIETIISKLRNHNDRECYVWDKRI